MATPPPPPPPGDMPPASAASTPASRPPLTPVDALSLAGQSPPALPGPSRRASVAPLERSTGPCTTRSAASGRRPGGLDSLTSTARRGAAALGGSQRGGLPGSPRVVVDGERLVFTRRRSERRAPAEGGASSAATSRTEGAVTASSGAAMTPGGAAGGKSTASHELRTTLRGGRTFFADAESASSASVMGDAIMVLDADGAEAAGLLQVIPPSYLTWRYRLYCVLEGVPLAGVAERFSVMFNAVSVLFILVSIGVFCADSAPEMRSRPANTGPTFVVEATCIAFFVIEAGLRIVSVRSPRQLLNFFFIIDVVTILGFFLSLATPDQSLRGVSGPLRLLRVFRVFKLSRYSLSLRLAFGVLRSSMAGLSLLVLPLVIVTVVGGSLIYFFEVSDADGFDRDAGGWYTSNGTLINFQSIPVALWFSFTTVATVGYGDITPTSVGGRLVAGVLMLVGVLTLSLPNIVLGANLQHAFRRKQQAHAVRFLARRFRKVLFAVAAVRRMRRAAERRAATEALRRAEEAGDIGASIVSSRRASEAGATLPAENFFAGPAEFAAVSRRVRLPTVDRDNIRTWGGDRRTVVAPILLLQALLESCSGVGLVPEVAAAIQTLEPGAAQRGVVVTALCLAAGGYLRAFVLRRNTPDILLALTDAAVTELQSQPEVGGLECCRSAEHARIVWRQTTGTPVSFRLTTLHTAYPVWSELEGDVVAAADAIVDFKRASAAQWAFGQPRPDASAALTLGSLRGGATRLRAANAEVLGTVARIREELIGAAAAAGPAPDPAE